MRFVKRDEMVRTFPFSIFNEIISKFKIQVQEHIESAIGVMFYGHFLIFVVFCSRKASCAQYFRSIQFIESSKELPLKTNS